MSGAVGSHSQTAVRRVAQMAARGRHNATRRLATLGIDSQAAHGAIDDIRAHGRLTLNFHPDRRDSTGRTVAAGLLADSWYRSQFETGISNGGRFAVASGDRPPWESLLFDGAYDRGTVLRPVYGALDLFGDPYGGAPRFGSSFIVLKPACFERATFCMGDSHQDPEDTDTIDQIMSVLAGAIASHRSSSITCSTIANPAPSQALKRGIDNRFIEAQIHISRDRNTP